MKEPQDVVSTLRRRIAEEAAAQHWEAVDNTIQQVMPLLRAPTTPIPLSQSALAELFAYQGLALRRMGRAEESYQHLLAAEQLFNLDAESAMEWASGQGFRLQGAGAAPDAILVLETLKVLGDAMIRSGQPRAGEVLQQVVAVADMLGEPEEQWDARVRFAAFTAGLADWQGLLGCAREMGQLARAWNDLPRLLDSMHYFTEAYVGLQRAYRAIEAQRLVVDIAEFLGLPSLASEREELERLQRLEE